MDEMKKEKNEEIVIDFQRVFKALLGKAWLIAIVAVVCAVLTFVGTFMFVTPKYQSSVMFYVNNSSLDLGDLSASLSSSDISAARGLVKVYIIILNTRETLTEVKGYAEVDRSISELKGMITAQSVDSTEIFKVVVTSEDPYEAEAIAASIAHVLPKRIDSIIDGTSSEVVDAAVVASKPSSPNYVLNTLIGFLAGMLAVVAVVAVKEILNITIREENDIGSAVKHPVLAAVPDMEYHSKGGYYAYKKRAYKNSAYEKAAPDRAKTILLGKGINFAAAEAYKLLRTKVQFSFADEMECHVIGVSSALSGEGKSLTAVNLAYSMSQLGKKVLLIDCDMRRPSIADKLPVPKAPGLSEYLSGQVRGNNLIRLCGLEGEEGAFHVIAAGRIPPNPMELLSSAKMEKTLENLRKNYDYILLDLPPEGEVSDALAAARVTDGMLLVVRQDYCDRVALSSAARQFAFVNAKILGVVYNCARENTGTYRKYYNKYSKYGKRYYKAYKSYDNAQAQIVAEDEPVEGIDGLD